MAKRHIYITQHNFEDERYKLNHVTAYIYVCVRKRQILTIVFTIIRIEMIEIQKALL